MLNLLPLEHHVWPRPRPREGSRAALAGLAGASPSRKCSARAAAWARAAGQKPSVPGAPGLSPVAPHLAPPGGTRTGPRLLSWWLCRHRRLHQRGRAF